MRDVKTAVWCVALAAACTDPRARPVPPVVDVLFSSSFTLTSPGRILGSVYVFDADGVGSLSLSVRSSDSSFVGDSLLGLTGDAEATRAINWTVPPGLAIGTHVTVVARALDFAGFAASDTVRLTVQDTVATLR